MSLPPHQWLSVLLLGALLFFPVSKIIWVMSVRRLQRKLARELEPQEVDGQLNRARFISVLVSLVFSYFFHVNVITEFYG